jgi:hypothetical protein
MPGSAPALVVLSAELRTAFLALSKGETTFGQFNTRYNELLVDNERKLAELRKILIPIQPKEQASAPP